MLHAKVWNFQWVSTCVYVIYDVIWTNDEMIIDHLWTREFLCSLMIQIERRKFHLVKAQRSINFNCLSQCWGEKKMKKQLTAEVTIAYVQYS